MMDAARRSLLTALGASAFATACAPLPRIAGTEQEDPRGGIGGTGIVGTLTGFGSLLINGQRIEIAETAEILGPLGPLAQTDLAVGQVLSVEANRAEGVLQARRILIADPLIGPIDAVAEDRRSLTILGVRVLLDPSATLNATPGQRLVVSGLWRGTEIVATRLAPAEPGLDAIAGVMEGGTGDQITVSGISVRLSRALTAPPIGNFVILRGRAGAGPFNATAIAAGRFTGAAGALENLSVEGYLSPVPTAPGYEVDGLGHSFDTAARLDAFADGRTLFEGPYTGLFEVSTGLRLPEDAAERAEMLSRAERGTLAPASRLSARL
ncbi:MAG: DUF5666 domain-containing protein [Pseudomonadota bacterium]